VTRKVVCFVVTRLCSSRVKQLPTPTTKPSQQPKSRTRNHLNDVLSYARSDFHAVSCDLNPKKPTVVSHLISIVYMENIAIIAIMISIQGRRGTNISQENLTYASNGLK